jgi:tRNA/rRNA methyltransferase
MIVCYELFTTGMPKGLPQIPKLADSKEMECMYDRLKKILIEIDYIKDDNPDYRMMKIRRSFARAHLTSRDAATILGICRQIKWRINNLSKTQGTGKKDWGIEN